MAFKDTFLKAPQPSIFVHLLNIEKVYYSAVAELTIWRQDKRFCSPCLVKHLRRLLNIKVGN